MTEMASRSRTRPSSGAEVRARLSHPVIDGDSHMLEPTPLVFEYMAQDVGWAAVKKVLEAFQRRGQWYSLSESERRRLRVARQVWWVEPTRALDRATAMLPKLLASRLDEFGIDFMMLYPNLGIIAAMVPEEELRVGFVRATNRLAAELYAPYRDRIAPVAMVPMQTPDEALQALEYVVQDLGYRAIVINGCMTRSLPEDASGGWAAGGPPYYLDTLGLDSPYDYDPFWKRCVELGVAVTSHGGAYAWPERQSPSSFTFNHIGHFSAAADAFCKSVILGGVAKRFPDLNFAFLEGGAGWAHKLYFDVISHLNSRGPHAIMNYLRPDLMDVTEVARLIVEFGDPKIRKMYERFIAKPDLGSFPGCTFPHLNQRDALVQEEGRQIDEFAQSGIRRAEDLAKIFERFYFGCEADEQSVPYAMACRPKPLQPLLGADIGHFDVREPTEVLHEAFELVEEGQINEDDFKKFTFENVARLHAHGNPDFFKGTVVEGDVAKLLARAIRGGDAAVKAKTG